MKEKIPFLIGKNFPITAFEPAVKKISPKTILLKPLGTQKERFGFLG